MAKLNKVREELSQRFVEALNMGELPWHSYCQPEPLKTAVQKSHSKEPEL